MPRKPLTKLEQLTVNIKRNQDSLEGKLLAYVKQKEIAYSEAVVKALRLCWLPEMLAQRPSEEAYTWVIESICELEAAANKLRLLFGLPTQVVVSTNSTVHPTAPQPIRTSSTKELAFDAQGKGDTIQSDKDAPAKTSAVVPKRAADLF